MKRIFSLLFLGVLAQVNAQFTVNVNGQPVKANDVIKLADVKSMDVTFKKAAKIPEYTSGRTTLYININDDKGKFLNQWKYEVDGYTASNNFLYPKTPVTYIMWAENGKTDLTAFSSYTRGAQDMYMEYFRNVDYKKLEVSVNLIFEESISWDKYGKAQILIDPLVFYFNLWPDDNTHEMKTAGLKYTWNASSNFQKMYVDNYASGSLTGLRDKDVYTIVTTNGRFALGTYTISGSQDDEMNAIKSNLEVYLNYYPNACNGKKILKDLPVPDESRDWSSLIGFGKGCVIAELDRKNSSSFSSVKIWEPFSIGSVSGYKFAAIGKSYECTTTSAIITTVEGPADPNKMVVNNAAVLFMVKHPSDSKKLIMVYLKTRDGSIKSISELSPIMGDMVDFMSAIK